MLTARDNGASFRVRSVRFENGERYAVVVGPSGLPARLPNQWAILIRRPRVQFNTLRTDLGTVAHLYEWATRRKLDLDDRLESGSGLAPSEISALYQNLRYARTFGRLAAGEQLADVAQAGIVTGDTHASRVGAVRAYLVWAMERLLYRLSPGDVRVAEVRARIETMVRTAIEFRRPTSDQHSARRGLTPDQRERLLQIIHPSYPQNPFQRAVRFRNWVLVLLLLTFGFRRGESLKLYVSDVNVKGRRPSITLTRRPDDPNDMRAEAPSIKTLGRMVYLQPTLARLLDTFIVHHRPQFPGSDASPFLFFARSGKPISLRMVNYICEQITSRFPEFAGILSPHVLRHTFNDLFVQSGQQSGLTGEAIKKAQNYVNGWQPTSDQGAIYTRRTIEQNAQAISLEHQRTLFEV